MENSSKALIMGGHVLIFLVAITTGIFLYQTLIATQDTILISSESYSRESEHLSSDENYNRIVKGSEIFGTLMSGIESVDMSAVIRKDDYTPDRILVNGKTIDIQSFKEQYNGTYMASSIPQSELFKKLAGVSIDETVDYKLSYTFSNESGKEIVTAVYNKIENESD